MKNFFMPNNEKNKRKKKKMENNEIEKKMKWRKKKDNRMGAYIAQWIRLHLTSCGPGSNPKLLPYILTFCAIFVIVLRKGRN